jgi:hypothetical protein
LRKAVIKAKGKQIKISLSVSPLENNNSHKKMTKVVKTLLESENRTTGKRGTNTNLNTVVFDHLKGKQ